MTPEASAHPTSSAHPGDRRRTWGLTLGVTALVVMLAGLVVLQWQQSKTLDANAKLNLDAVASLAFQFERESLRLRHALDLATTQPPRLDDDELVLRYDIFRSRLNLLLNNPTVAPLQSRPEYQALLPRLVALGERGDAVFNHPPHRDELLALQTALTPLGPDIQALSLAATSEMARLIETKQATIRAQARFLQGMTLALAVVLAAVAVMVRHRQRLDARKRADLEQLTHELRAAQQKAEAANQGKTRFLANMSHELRTPFNGVLGMLTLLESSPLQPDQRDQVETAKSSAQHLLALLNDILDVSALEAGKLTIQPEPVHLPSLLGQVAALMHGAATAKGLTFDVDGASALPPWGLTDPTRLKQILFNVIGNGIKFTHQGGVRLRVMAAAPEDDARTVTVRWAVTDSGIGMDAAAMARLFQRFEQVESHAARRFGGTGLGLEISRTLARLMGGDLTVTSAPGEGSTFTLSLPLPLCDPPPPVAPSTPLSTHPSAPPTASTLRGCRVLVAEDHPVNRKLVGALLERLGCDTRFAENGQQAVEAMAQAGADLVLMDIHMPVMDGLTATQAIRAMAPPHGTVPIIALSADVMNDAQEKALAAGVTAFLSKPLRLAELEAQMRRLTGRNGPE